MLDSRNTKSWPAHFPTQAFRTIALASVFSFAIIGCSGSSDSSEDQSVNGTSAGNSTNDTVANNNNNGTANDDANANDAQSGTEQDVDNSDSDTIETDESNEPLTDQTQTNSEEPEPASPTTTRVDFDITVPVYMPSDELQVLLSWGDLNKTANWVLDESWTVSQELPVNTENLLTVTFADRNGAVKLASFENTFKTGTAASQVVQITADQFSIDQWDNDNDGVSNFDELLAGRNPNGDNLPPAVEASLDVLPIKTFRISWQTTPDARYYRVLENPDGISGFSDISGELEASATGFDHVVALYARINAQYLVQSCNSQGCTDSAPVMVSGTLDNAIGFFKGSNTEAGDVFGAAVALSADGSTLAVGAYSEESAETGTGVPGNDNSAPAAGAVYVFVQRDGLWQQQAYLKANNAGTRDLFGGSVSLSADGNTLAVSSWLEDSAATGVNGDQNDNSARYAGAVYMFVRSGALWQQQAYLKASNTDAYDRFGYAVSLSADGNTLGVGASGEDSASVGINGDQSDNSAIYSGAAYVFIRVGDQWQQQAYVKPDFIASNIFNGAFGAYISLSGDGDTLAVGVQGLANPNTNIAGTLPGAVYVFVRDGGQWRQEAFVQASNLANNDFFGRNVSLSTDGNTLAVGAWGDDSSATGINGDENDNSAANTGAVYVFVRNSGLWQQQAYIKASNPDSDDYFGSGISLSGDGNKLAVGAWKESSVATGINGDESDNSANQSGAVYVFFRSGETWRQQAYVKASNTQLHDSFSHAEKSVIAFSADGNTLAIGAGDESSASTGIGGDQTDNSARDAGVVYLY